MRQDLDFKYQTFTRLRSLKLKGKKARKKTYLAAGEPVFKEAKRERMIPDSMVLIARVDAFKLSVSKYATLCGVSVKAMRNAMTGLTYKHLNIIAKPLK
jgi:hypothetical protein